MLKFRLHDAEPASAPSKPRIEAVLLRVGGVVIRCHRDNQRGVLHLPLEAVGDIGSVSLAPPLPMASYGPLRWRVTRKSRAPALYGAALKSLSQISLTVLLPSGQGHSISIAKDSTLSDLKVAVQEALGRGFLRLVTADGHFLDPKSNLPLHMAGIHNGDSVTAIAQSPGITATKAAFALWCCNSGVVTWGDTEWGADSRTVQDQLRNVQQISSTDEAFAALCTDGSVVTWGDPELGGDSSEVHYSSPLQEISASADAFAALRNCLRPFGSYCARRAGAPRFDNFPGRSKFHSFFSCPGCLGYVDAPPTCLQA
ncbi:unnamed protein product [Durusdinium trenchii]|uniref:Ubiquitin-like domain-containing protein n=1 Tax=Durusdinium trenchii TaxID=1381693 RepID=A0ABP0S4R8_9DINO